MSLTSVYHAQSQIQCTSLVWSYSLQPPGFGEDRDLTHLPRLNSYHLTPSSCTKTKSKWIKDLNVKPETLKLLEETQAGSYKIQIQGKNFWNKDICPEIKANS